MINHDKHRLVMLYIVFAVLSTIVNIAAQDVSTRIYTGMGYIVLSMLVGTFAGLVVKYVLDKRYIFSYRTQNAAHNSKTFALYTSMGIVTTAIFWGTELAFEWVFNDKTMRYVGACIGLGIGYVIKYFLDKKYVFV